MDAELRHSLLLAHEQHALEGLKKAMAEGIWMTSFQERRLRESTITLLTSSMENRCEADCHCNGGAGSKSAGTSRSCKRFNLATIMQLVERQWTDLKDMAYPSFWSDAKCTYIEFKSPYDKHLFLKTIEEEQDVFKSKLGLPLINLVKEPDLMTGHHYKRRPIRLELSSVSPSIDSQKLLHKLISYAPDVCEITPLVRSGLITPFSDEPRNLTFTVNAAGFTYIFDTLGGIIRYNDLGRCGSIKLYPKIIACPYVCNDCYRMGAHKCLGSCCPKCAGPGHRHFECPKKLAFCVNCKRFGHRSKDINCSSYVNEFLKELRKLDIPLEFYEEDHKRFLLLKSLILRK